MSAGADEKSLVKGRTSRITIKYTKIKVIWQPQGKNTGGLCQI